jgi:hypothetical protein
MLNAKGVIMTVTSEQIRAARALLRWEQKDLAEGVKGLASFDQAA